MNKLNLNLVKRFIILAKLYWLSKEKWKATGLLVLLILLLLGDTWFNVLFNAQSGEFTSALAAGEAGRFWSSIRQYLVLLLVAVPIYSYYYYVRDKLAINWRRWMTQRLLGQYFENRAYYRLLQDPAIDNPDQRISEDIASFTQQSLNFLLLIAGSAFSLVAFSKVLWTISHSLVLFLTLYALAGTIVTFRVFGGRMVLLNFEKLKREADLRFGLVRIRENAESIALYRGERQEQAQVLRRFREVFLNVNRLIQWSLRFNFFTYTYGLITLVLPSVIIAPRVLSGELEVGLVVQAAGAFSAILSALTVFVDNMDSLSRFAAGVDRLDAFVYAIARPGTHIGAERSRIVTREGDQLAMQEICLQTPNYERSLVTGLTCKVAPGESLMIVGASGCGKSSLLRMMAGLWDSGSGQLERPKPEDMLFLPQHAYMVLGDLRRQLSYPTLERTVSDEELREILKRVRLPGLEERCGGFDVDLNFENVLSVGERQRLAFARVLLNHPRYVLLDESTSALDHENESALYREMLATSTTLVSVSHHPRLVKYHSQVLELTGDGGWHLHPADQFRFREETE